MTTTTERDRIAYAYAQVIRHLRKQGDEKTACEMEDILLEHLDSLDSEPTQPAEWKPFDFGDPQGYV